MRRTWFFHCVFSRFDLEEGFFQHNYFANAVKVQMTLHEFELNE